MADFKISVDLSGIANAVTSVVNQQVFPLLTQAVRGVAQQTAINWVEGIQRANLWSVEKQQYAQSVKAAMTGPFSALVYSDYDKAEEIENGRPPRDLKTMLNTSLKVRVSKKGRRYMFIPFRHTTPGTNGPNVMSPDVYALAKALTPSSITGQTTRLSGTGAYNMKTQQRLTVPQNTYAWGEKLDFRKESTWMKAPGATRNQQGMYRFDTSTGGAKSSQYLTFRTMAEGSPGWIVPAQPGLDLAKTVAINMQPLAEKAFGEAINRTLAQGS